MRKRWFKIVAIVVLIFLPIGIHWLRPVDFRWLYRKVIDYPEEITIATGAEGGRYYRLGEDLAGEIRTKLGVKKVRVVKTEGSLENLLLLREGKAHFAFYQPGTQQILSKLDPACVRQAEREAQASPLPQSPGAESVAFVANLYSQPAQLVVRRGAGIESPADLIGKRVHVGLKSSGDYAMSLALLDALDLREKVVKVSGLGYGEVAQRFKTGTLDATFITVGTDAEVFRKLAETGRCDVISLPYRGALEKELLFASAYTVPAALYSYLPHTMPENDVQTLAAAAQLLTRTDVSTTLVRDVTKLVLEKSFIRANHLDELFAGGHEFALTKPEFEIHPGAQYVYDPEFHPLLPADLVESCEGIRSFVVSFIIAAFFGVRWLKERRVKKRGHKLDRYIRALLEIEERQRRLDETPQANDERRLQELLDAVTSLRQKALRDYSAYELNEDRGADCFIEMCHALSNKINAKISRQRIDKRFDELAAALRGSANRT